MPGSDTTRPRLTAWPGSSPAPPPGCRSRARRTPDPLSGTTSELPWCPGRAPTADGCVHRAGVRSDGDSPVPSLPGSVVRRSSRPASGGPPADRAGSHRDRRQRNQRPGRRPGHEPTSPSPRYADRHSFTAAPRTPGQRFRGIAVTADRHSFTCRDGNGARQAARRTGTGPPSVMRRTTRLIGDPRIGPTTEPDPSSTVGLGTAAFAPRTGPADRAGRGPRLRPVTDRPRHRGGDGDARPGQR